MKGGNKVAVRGGPRGTVEHFCLPCGDNRNIASAYCDAPAHSSAVHSEQKEKPP